MADRQVYLTRDGYDRLVQELAELRLEKRPQIEERIRLAKEFSDTVDNAEYDGAKQEQSFVEGRIQELEQLLAEAGIRLKRVACRPIAHGAESGRRSHDRGTWR